MPGARHLTFGPGRAAVDVHAPQRINLVAVLRLLDARTGSYAEVRPAQSGLLRVCAYLPETAGGTDISWLRMLLVADVFSRAAELSNLQVLTVLVSAGQDRAQVAAYERAVGALGIHRPAVLADVQEAPDGPVDVHLVSHDADPHGSQNGLVARVGSAHLRGTADHDGAIEGDVLAGPGQDPLAIRLALLSLPYYQQAELTEPMLASAQETAAHWRHQVAGWAESPSSPIPPTIAETFRVAFGDLDTPTVLALLHDLTRDTGLPVGAKFETFLYADRVLGLDLPRDIGRASG
jgi:hypothetical protein